LEEKPKIPRRNIEGRVALNVFVTEDIHEWVRVESAKRRVPMWEIVQEALERHRDHLERNRSGK
jgi:hypothetical protein